MAPLNSKSFYAYQGPHRVIPRLHTESTVQVACLGQLYPLPKGVLQYCLPSLGTGPQIEKISLHVDLCVPEQNSLPSVVLLP